MAVPKLEGIRKQSGDSLTNYSKEKCENLGSIKIITIKFKKRESYYVRWDYCVSNIQHDFLLCVLNIFSIYSWISDNVLYVHYVRKPYSGAREMSQQFRTLALAKHPSSVSSIFMVAHQHPLDKLQSIRYPFLTSTGNSTGMWCLYTDESKASLHIKWNKSKNI